MARRPISGVVRDGLGAIVASATVALAVYDGGAAATCYDAETGGSAISGGATTSGTNGAYTFWVDDSDYGLMTLFNVTASKSGYTQMITPVAA